MKDGLSSGVNGVLDHGIDLRLESLEEENYYIQQMCEFFNEETGFKAYLSGDRSFDIEIDKDNPVLEVLIRESCLTIIPYSEDIFEVFTLILGFIAKRHTSIVREFREIGVHKIQSPDEVGVNNDTDEDSDDFEWI